MHKRVILLVLGCLFSILFISGCAGDSGELQAGYYKKIVMQPNGNFIGKDKIDDKKAAESGLVYKVEMNEQKKLSKITAMIHEQPIDIQWFDTTYSWYGKFAAIVIEYQDGYIKYSFKNARMQPDIGYYGSYSLRYKLDEKKVPAIAYCYNKDGDQNENAKGFAQMLFTYDDKGFLTKIGYANSRGERITTNWKEYELGLKYAKDSKKNNLPIEISNLSKDGELMLNITSAAKKTYKYDEKGRLSEIRHFGTDGSLKERTLENFDMVGMLGGVGAGAITKYKYVEDQTNPSEISFYGKDEQPVGVKALDNAASIKFKYGELGNVAEVSLFGTDGLPRAIDANALGNDIVTMKNKVDEVGNLIEVALYNKDGNLTALKGTKSAIQRSKYDNKRQQIEENYFGTSEEPVEIIAKGYRFHKKIMEYDDDGKLIKTTYYDKEDKDIKGANQNNFNQQSNSAISRFYGTWYMNGPNMAESGHIAITEREVVRIPLHDVDRIPKNTWKRNAYTISSINVNPNTGEGFAILKFDDGSMNRFTLNSANSMTWDKYKYTWEKKSSSTNY